MIIPASALGRGDRPAPSERITMAAIGFGTIAHATAISLLGDKRVQMVAVCDVNKLGDHYGYAGELQGGRDYGCKRVNEHYGNRDCKGYADFREVLARDDIDAINVSTPDHWHSIMAVEGARGRKTYLRPEAAVVDRGRGSGDVRRGQGGRRHLADRQPATLERALPPRLRVGPQRIHRQGQDGPGQAARWAQRLEQAGFPEGPTPVPRGSIGTCGRVRRRSASSDRHCTR